MAFPDWVPAPGYILIWAPGYIFKLRCSPGPILRCSPGCLNNMGSRVDPKEDVAAASAAASSSSLGDLEYDTTHVRPMTHGKSSNLTGEELAQLREERQAAAELGVDWRDRGPTDAPFWRGQSYRQGHCGGSKGYRNRGGKWREYYAELNRKGCLMPSKGGAKRVGEGEATAAVKEISEKNAHRKGLHKGKGEGDSAGK